MTAALRPGMPELPQRMRHLRVDERGYPVPWFVSWIDGKPEFRIADGEKRVKAVRFGLCWVCGERVGQLRTFVIGPMCAVNRVTAEPPCHLDCAVFSATACPFLTLPKSQRREANLPDVASHMGGVPILRNPGVTCLWTTRDFRPFNSGDGGWLIRLGEAEQVDWFTQKRRAAREEVLASIDSGMPILREMAEQDGPKAIEALGEYYDRMLPLLPAAA